MNDYNSSDDRAVGLATAERALPSQCALRSRTWFSLAMIALVFLAGGICGAAVTRVAFAHKPLTKLDELPGRVANRMQRDLGLSDSQRDRLEQIGQAHQAELRRIRAQVAPQMRAELHLIIDEMAAVLTPEQAQRWREHAEHRLDALVPAADGTEPERATP